MLGLHHHHHHHHPQFSASFQISHLRLPPCLFLPQRTRRNFQLAIASSAPPAHHFFATCAPGLEALVAAELSSPSIAASNIQIGSSGVSFSGTFLTAYNANLWLRCAIRVLIQLASSQLPTGGRHDPVYDFVRGAVDWPTLLIDDEISHKPAEELALAWQEETSKRVDGWGGKGKTSRGSGSPGRWKFRTFAVQSRTHDCLQVNNSMYASVRAKDAICDAIRDACGGLKPDPPEDGGAAADIPLFLSLYKDQAVLYRDMSGVSLHRRGYRDAMHRASLNEAIAAGILTMAGWNRWVSGFGACNKRTASQGSGHGGLEDLVLLDPMCGSGTLLIEAALMASNRAPGLMRSHWPFQTWHDFDKISWKECQKRAAAAEVSPPRGLRLLGNDIHDGAHSLCLKDTKSAGVHDLVELSCKDCRDYIPPTHPSLVVVNPPWGTRLGGISDKEAEDVASTWQGLGQFLKQRCNCADVYVLSGNSSVTRGLQMKADRKWPITVGGVECKLLHYYVLPPKKFILSKG